jgi:hypothetical protein
MEPYPHHYTHLPESTDPSIYTMVDELQRMVQRLGEKVQGRCDDLETCVDAFEQRAEECFIVLEIVRTEADVERADLHKHFYDVKLEVARLNRFMEHETMANLQSKTGILTTNELVSTRSPLMNATDGSERHRSDLHTRDREFGPGFTQTHIPANGTPYPKSDFHGVEHDSAHSAPHPPHFDLVRSSHGKLPKINFPVFTSEDPQLRCTRCVNYFDMNGVESSLCVRVASMLVEGLTTRWLQSVERRLRTTGWNEFCALVHDRFSHDQHESLIRQLFHIRQGGSVAEYVE